MSNTDEERELLFHEAICMMRKKKEGLKNLFLEKLEPKKSKEEMVQQLISILKKNGWNIKK